MILIALFYAWNQDYMAAPGEYTPELGDQIQRNRTKMWSQADKLREEHSDALVCDRKNTGCRPGVRHQSWGSSPDFWCAGAGKSDPSTPLL